MIKKLNIENWGAVCHIDKCFYPKCGFGERLIIPLPRDTTTHLTQRINVDYVFHLHESHGLDAETFVETLQGFLYNNYL